MKRQIFNVYFKIRLQFISQSITVLVIGLMRVVTFYHRVLYTVRRLPSGTVYF